MNLKFNPRWAWNNNDISLILSESATLVYPIVHICSGSSNIGNIRIDIVNTKLFSNNGWGHREKYRGIPNILGDMNRIPLKDSSAGGVICDPPYDTKFFDGDGFNEMVRELIRICKPNGKILFYSPWVITHPAIELLNIIPKKTGAKRSYMKLLSIHRKWNGQIGDY